MANENLSFNFSANISQFQSAIASVQSSLKETGQQLKDIGGNLTTYVSLPLAALGAAALKSFGDIQALKSGLTAVTGSAAKTEEQFKRLTVIAKLPGLGLQEAVKGAINLQVIGFSAGKAEKAMMALGNAVATVGKGKVEFEGALYGLQQLASTDMPLAEDLNIIKERIPQITPLLKEAFGTARSDELQKLGISSAQLVDTIINGLSKLPPVTGGINAAFENLGDGVKNNLADVGEIINNTFDISAIIDSVVSKMTELVTYFKSLSPEIQKSVVIFGALAIVIPPILVALGALITTIIPALIAGFGALLSPVALIIAAVVGAAVLIVQNWDTIVAYFTSGEGSKFWGIVKAYGEELWNNLKSIFNSIKNFSISLWKSIGENLTAIVGTSFGLLKDIITGTLGVISGVFKVFSSLLKGDWAGLWEGVKSITASLWNGITNILKGFVKGASNVLATFFKLIGADSIANGLSNLASGMDSLFAKIQIPVKAATAAVKDFKKEVAGVKSVSTSVEDEKTTYKKGGVKGDKAKNKVAEVYSELEIGLKQIDSLFGATFDDKAKKKVDEYQQAINALIKNGFDPASTAIKNLQKEQLKFNLLQDSHNSATIIQPKKGKEGKGKLVSSPISTAFDQVSEEQRKILAKQESFNNDFNNLVQSGLGSGISDAFNSIGEAFGAGGNVMEAFGTSILKSFSGFLGDFGDLLIQYGMAAVLKGKLDLAALVPGAGILAGGAAIAAGIALKVAAGAFGGLANKAGKKEKEKYPTAFAKGGIVSGKLTNAMVGEYPSAGRGNPEIIAPLNDLKGMLGGEDGFSGDVRFEIGVDKLVGILDKNSKRQYRTR